MTIKDSEFIEEGTVRRTLKLVNGQLVEVGRGPAMFSEFSGLIRGTKTGKLYNKYEVLKEKVE